MSFTSKSIMHCFKVSVYHETAKYRLFDKI